MPAYHWSPEYSPWIKRCGNKECHIGLYIGTADEQESQEYFAKTFSGRQWLSRDSLQSWCIECVGAYSHNRDYCDRELLLNRQNGLCAICNEEMSWTKKTARVDHDRKTRKVRGILCHRCNTAISILDNRPLLHLANEYIAKHEEECELECE